MLTLMRLGALAAIFICGISLSANAASMKTGSIAEQQLRHIATYFPGRMAGSPADMLTADYLQQQFTALGYQTNQRRFTTRYAYQHQAGDKTWRNVNATSVIAAREGKVAQQIVIVAHSDSWTPHNDNETQLNLGGLTNQGVDDNASGLGVMLELAQRLSTQPLHYSLRFVALSGEEIGLQGSEDYVSRMTPEEKHNTLLVINLDSLVVGSHLTFISGRQTPKAVARQTRDRARSLARHLGSARRHRPRKMKGLLTAPVSRCYWSGPAMRPAASCRARSRCISRWPCVTRHSAIIWLILITGYLAASPAAPMILSPCCCR